MKTNAVESIQNHTSLLAEKERLESLIRNQKNIVRHDFQELRLQFKTELRPAIDAGKMIKKVFQKDQRNQTLVSLTITFATDILLKRFFRNTPWLIRIIAPGIIRKSSMFLLRSFNK